MLLWYVHSCSAEGFFFSAEHFPSLSCEKLCTRQGRKMLGREEKRLAEKTCLAPEKKWYAQQRRKMLGREEMCSAEQKKKKNARQRKKKFSIKAKWSAERRSGPQKKHGRSEYAWYQRSIVLVGHRNCSRKFQHKWPEWITWTDSVAISVDRTTAS